MAEVTQERIVKLLKQDDELTQGKVAQKLGVSTGQVPMLLFCKAQVEVGIYKKAPATAASVKKLRDNENNRWELIAARTGQGVAAVKSLYEEAGGDVSKSYTGRGRNFNGGGNKKAATGSSGRSTGGKTTGGKSTGRQTGGKTTGRTTGKTTGRQTAAAGRKTTAGGRRNPS